MVLIAPVLHPAIPVDSNWLGGEASGSWFHIAIKAAGFRIIRYSPEGTEECSGLFGTSKPFSLDVPYKMSYPSHCLRITLIQNGDKVIFKRISD